MKKLKSVRDLGVDGSTFLNVAPENQCPGSTIRPGIATAPASV